MGRTKSTVKGRKSHAWISQQQKQYHSCPLTRTSFACRSCSTTRTTYSRTTRLASTTSRPTFLFLFPQRCVHPCLVIAHAGILVCCFLSPLCLAQCGGCWRWRWQGCRVLLLRGHVLLLLLLVVVVLLGCESCYPSGVFSCSLRWHQGTAAVVGTRIEVSCCVSPEGWQGDGGVMVG